MPASQILEKLPFPAQMKGKGAVLWERGLLLGGQIDPFFTTSCHYSFYYFHDEVCQIASKFLYKHFCFDKHYFFFKKKPFS